MRNLFRNILLVVFLLSCCIAADAQTDRKEVRSGNRQFKKENFQRAEIDYRKAQVKDTASFAANYNLANALYRQDNFEEAGTVLEKIKDTAPVSKYSADYFYNLGDVALQKKDYKAAVDAFKQSLLRNPGDLDAKENYIYAKLMLDNQGGGGGNDQNNQDQQNQDQQQDQNNQDNQQNQDNQNQDQQNQDQKDQQGQGEARISPQQAQQMLNAIQAKEKETQDKVNKEKAAILKSKQKEKNW